MRGNILSQFYGLKASLTDFPIGIIIQPEFIDTDASFKINQYTSAPDSISNEKVINATLTFKKSKLSKIIDIAMIVNVVLQWFILIKRCVIIVNN